MSLNPNSSNTISLDYDAYAATHPEREPAEPNEHTALDYRKLYEQTQSELRTANALLTATQQSSALPASEGEARPNTTFTQLYSRLGWHGLDKLSDVQLAQAIGLPAAPTREEVLRYFSSSSSQMEMSQLMRSDPKRYRSLKEFGRCRRII